MEAPKMMVDCIHPSTENARKLVKYAWLFHPTHCIESRLGRRKVKQTLEKFIFDSINKTQESTTSVTNKNKKGGVKISHRDNNYNYN